MSLRDDDDVVNPSGNTHLSDLIDSSLSRRGMLKAGGGAALLSFFGVGFAEALLDDGEIMLGFEAIATSSGDNVVVPPGYKADVILRWGDPLFIGAPDFVNDASQGWEAQEKQVGDNHDGMAFFGFRRGVAGLSSMAGLLVMNHEYINPEYFYEPGTDPANWLNPFTLDKARKALAAHGITVAEVRKQGSKWVFLKASRYNRRITGYTPMTLSGPAAGHALLQTADDPAGTTVLGTLNNCANGYTPWGTYLTCEENFNGYFGWNGARTPSALENRYGLTQNGFGYRWHEVDPRFDMNVNPNEPNRFGWIVEIDPFDPTSTPKKRTALGRFKHENAEAVVAPNGKVVVYMGCDERNEYIYKFVSDGTYDPVDLAANADILDTGTLYVARFTAGAVADDKMGDGQWIALVYGQNGLTAENGFTSQADVLIRARQAADRVGATMMDRPEWITANPKSSGEIYIALTNNSRRGTNPPSSNNPDGSTVAGAARPPVDDANPRAVNNWGHILRWNETAGDPTALTFAWDLFLVAGNPIAYPAPDARAGSSNITTDNTFNSPDGLAFDNAGRLWIQTDGNFSNTGDYLGQGNNQMLAADISSGEVRRFLVGPSGCEVTGVTWTPDRKTMFVNIQHPGEMGSHPNKPSGYTDNDIARDATAFSKWPEGKLSGRPRSATVVITRLDGGVIGT